MLRRENQQLKEALAKIGVKKDKGPDTSNKKKTAEEDSVEKETVAWEFYYQHFFEKQLEHAQGNGKAKKRSVDENLQSKWL